MGVTIKATGESKLFTALVLQSVFEFPPTFFSNSTFDPLLSKELTGGEIMQIKFALIFAEPFNPTVR